MTAALHKRVLPFILALVATVGWAIQAPHRQATAQANTLPNLVNDRAGIIHQAVLTIDSHIDWPIRQSLNPEFDAGIGHETGAPGSGQWDLVRMEAGELDAAFITLTHSKNNQLGDLSTDEQQAWQGLSPFGEAVVHKMNRLGIMVDVSHVHAAI